MTALLIIVVEHIHIISTIRTKTIHIGKKKDLEHTIRANYEIVIICVTPINNEVLNYTPIIVTTDIDFDS